MNDGQWTMNHKPKYFGFCPSRSHRENSDSPPHPYPPPRGGSGREGGPHSAFHIPQSGVSLIEFILVMVVMAILAAVVIPRVGFDTSPRASVEGGAYMIASDIRYVQECAMATRTSKTITFSGGNSYSFSPSNNLDPSGQLPGGITASALILTFNSLGEPIIGGGGTVIVSGSGGTKTISVANYTGKVSIN